MKAHIQLYERIRDSIGDEFQKVRGQVYHTIEKRRAKYLELDQDLEDGGHLHYSDFSDPLKNPEMQHFLSFTDDQIQSWMRGARIHESASQDH